MNIKTFAAAVVATAIAGSAFAADLPSRKVAPAYIAPAPIFTWTGFYIGVNVGYGFGKDNQAGSWSYPVAAPIGNVGFAFAQNSKGILGGGQIGYNYQLSPMFVVGVEADIQGANIKSSSVDTGFAGLIGIFPQMATLAVNQKVSWFGSVRGRLGVTAFSPKLLAYVTGGLAYGKVSSSAVLLSQFPTFPAFALATDAAGSTRLGWTVGAGLEYALSNNWSIKGEYLYTDLGSLSATGQAPIQVAVGDNFIYNRTASVKFHTVRAGLNYRFGWGAAPVVAKY